MRKLERKGRKKNVIRKCIGIAILLLAVAAGMFAYREYTKDDEDFDDAKTIYDDASEKAHQNKKKKNKETDKVEDTINWEEFAGYNVVGWVKIGDLADYPIVQGDDNSYYLRHVYDGTYNGNGSIFMHCDNNSDFMDLNTIVYGHNMSYTGMMFGKLKQLLEYSDDNPKEFYIYMPDGTKHTYDIYSIDRVKDLGYAYQIHFGSVTAYSDYKDELKKNSEYDTGIEKNENKTVVLSTCTTGSAYGNRIVIVGQERESEQIQEPASWYVKKNYIEIDNQKALCYTEDDVSYIVQDGIALQVRPEDVKDIIPDTEHVIVRVQYESTDEVYIYTDLSGNTETYAVACIIDYVVE